MPPVAPPIYDGCITEPYRYLGGNPAPTSTSKAYQPTSDFQPAEVITDESPAQGQVLMMTGTFVSSEPFTVTVAPVQPPQPPPTGKKFEGNVYRIVATSSSGKLLEPRAGVPATIVLRAATSTGPQRTLVRLDGTGWTPLMTVAAGCGDEYEATSDRLGDFAMVEPAGSTPSQPGGFPAAVLIPVIVVVLLGSVFLLLRLNRRVTP